MNKTILSPEQDNAANPNDNVWVQANAGTGKTSVLVQRLLRILFRTPDCLSTGILCLTYTNAGAGEMRNRILKALRQWATATDADLAELLDGVSIHRPITADDIAHARSIFFHYIDNPDILKIKTIHGFCEEILHRFPVEAGLSPSWTLVSDSSQRVLLQDAFDRLINSPNEDSRVQAAFAHIVGRISEYTFSDLLDVLSEQYKSFFGITDIDKYRKYFIETTSKYLELDNVPDIEVEPSNLEAIITFAQGDAKPAKFLDKIISLTKQYLENTIDFEKYKTAYLTKEGTKNVNVAKRPYLVDEQDRVYAINQYQSNQLLFQDTVALFDLSAAFANEYHKIKRAGNLLDFEDMILYTRKLFSDSATMGWVLSQLDYSLSHILLDEAQDTSPQQWDILRMLAGDFFADGNTSENVRSLFVVGDSKQSIYGFQGADPAAFAFSRDAIAQQIQQNLRTLCEIPLAQSFRSTLPVLNSVDKFFTDPDVIALSDFANNAHKCFRAKDPGLVEIHKLVAKMETETTTKGYVSDIADKIKSILDAGKYQAKDIMVLVQRRHPFVAPLVYELKRRNIDVAGSDRIVLPNFPAVRDLLNLIRWCLNPADDYSLCCVLKSPIFYLTEDDIFNLCNDKNIQNSHRKETTEYVPKTSVFDVLKSLFPDIHTRLCQIRSLSKYAGPYSFFTQILNTNNTRQKFISALGDQVIDPLEEFLTICLSYERTQPGTLHHFIKWFITGGSEIKRDMDASSGVRIVTVHGSKGLEARVVFLIDTTRVPQSENVLPLPSKEYPVWLWSPHSSASVPRATAADGLMRIRLAEYYRLLYVAMTRARDELYIYGYTANKNATANSWHAELWRVFAGKDSCMDYIRITNEDVK